MNYFKTLFSVLTLFLFVFTSNTLFAQYPGMAAVYKQIDRQNIQQQKENFQQQSFWMMNKMLLKNSRFSSEIKAKYHVQLIDSNFQEVNSFMFTDTILHKDYLVFENTKYDKSDSSHRFEKIFPNNTIKISTAYEGNTDVEVDGVPNDTCWYFRVISGSLRVYAKSFNYLFNVNQAGGSEIIISSIVGIQSNNGPIIKFNEENLAQIFGNNVKAIQLLQKKKYLKAINRYNSDKLDEMSN